MLVDVVAREIPGPWPVVTVWGPVVRRLISTNQGLNLNLAYFCLCSNAFSLIIFSILFRVANHQVVDKKN